jgi:hypothetical protein
MPDSARARMERWHALDEWAKRHWEIAKKHHWEDQAHRYWQAFQAYDKKYDWLKTHVDPKPAPIGELLVVFDGHMVPSWMVHQALQPARSSGEWSGSVFSGFRSPEYSTQLCINMCGHPTCPGTCAGASSNHSCPPTHTGEEFEGAVDVTDPFGLRHWCETHGNPIIGGGAVLSGDVPHFSRSGR